MFSMFSSLAQPVCQRAVIDDAPKNHRNLRRRCFNTEFLLLQSSGLRETL